jgi:hypothetical protein
MASQWDLLSACDIDRGKLMISTRDPWAISITSQVVYGQRLRTIWTAQRRKRKRRDIFIISLYQLVCGFVRGGSGIARMSMEM